MTIPTAGYYLRLVYAVIDSLSQEYNKTDSKSSVHTKRAIHDCMTLLVVVFHSRRNKDYLRI